MIETLSDPGAGASQADEVLARRAASIALQLAGRDPEEAGLTVVLTDDEGIARLNEQYRGVRGPTDVLSFEAEAGFPGMEDEMGGYLGDVVVSLPRAREQGASAGHGAEHELALLVAHGTLHLLGHDHAGGPGKTKMWALQEQVACGAVVEPT